jgi:hypothetical protein
MASRKRDKTPRPVRWVSFSMLSTAYTRRDRVLGVIVDPSTCVVLAFEGPTPRFGEPELEGLAAFFGDHAHALVHSGEGLTLADAVRIAEEYGQKWKAAGDELARCDCPELGAEARA